VWLNCSHLDTRPPKSRARTAGSPRLSISLAYGVIVTSGSDVVDKCQSMPRSHGLYGTLVIGPKQLSVWTSG
jgi:hypothetical protein